MLIIQASHTTGSDVKAAFIGHVQNLIIPEQGVCLRTHLHILIKSGTKCDSNRTGCSKEKPTADYPLYLTTGRVMSHYLTGVQTRKSAALAARHFESFMEIHPQTAATYNIEDRVLVK